MTADVVWEGSVVGGSRIERTLLSFVMLLMAGVTLQHASSAWGVVVSDRGAAAVDMVPPELKAVVLTMLLALLLGLFATHLFSPARRRR